MVEELKILNLAFRGLSDEDEGTEEGSELEDESLDGGLPLDDEEEEGMAAE